MSAIKRLMEDRVVELEARRDGLEAELSNPFLKFDEIEYERVCWEMELVENELCELYDAGFGG